MEEITSKYGIPTTIEEAIEGIDKFETDLKNGKVNWTSSEEFDKQLYEEFPWLRQTGASASQLRNRKEGDNLSPPFGILSKNS